MSEAASFRRILDPPRLRNADDADGERHATWLELFFDLVFVVAIAQLSNALSADQTLEGFLVFCGLFLPVWWAWVGFTFYADRFDTDDVVHRLFMLAGMFAVGAMASTIPDAANGGGGTAAFAVAYIAVRVFTIALNARAWLHVPAARPLLDVYLTAFTVAVGLWAVSLAFEGPARYVLWAVAMAIDIGTPLASRARIQRVPIHAAHIPERVGLFTIIVLGETILAVVVGTETATWTLEAGLVAALGFAVGASLWWLYFDYVDETLIRRSVWAGQVYLYGHVPLLIGLTSLGVGVKYAIKDTSGSALADSSRWILCGGVALAFGALALVHLATTRSRRDPDLWLRGGTAAAALVLAAVGGGLDPLPVLAILAALVAAQVAFEVVGHADAHGHDAAESAASPMRAVEPR